MNAADQAKFVRDSLPPGGLFAGLDWRISPEPFPLRPDLAKEIESLGRVLLQFYRAVNLLYRKSVEGKQPEWVARWLDLGKPAELIALQRSPAFKNDVPRVIRPDLLLTEQGISVTELDSVPGGIGLTAWLNQTYSILSEGGVPRRPNQDGARRARPSEITISLAVRTGCCAGLNPSSVMRSRFTSSYPRKRRRIGRRWFGSRSN